MNLRKYLVLLSVVLFSSAGDVLLSRGMKQFGEIRLSHVGDIVFALGNPWILAGIFFLLIFFASYLTALSWADLTFVLPATAFSYVMMALLARVFLHEEISLTRWAGILLIVAGVGFVAGGPSHTETEKEARPLPRSHPHQVPGVEPSLAEMRK